MSFFGRLPKLLLVFWLIQIAIIAILWQVLPTRSSGIVLILLVAVNGALLYRQLFELPVFTNVALILALAHLWMGSGFTSPLLSSALIFVGIALSGLIVQAAASPIDRESILVWFMVGLFTAQMSSLTAFWPISYLQKSLLCTIIFYLVWQTWQVIGVGRRGVLGHFIFISLAVIVVIANIIWTTWPGLKTF